MLMLNPNTNDYIYTLQINGIYMHRNTNLNNKYVCIHKCCCCVGVYVHRIRGEFIHILNAQTRSPHIAHILYSYICMIDTAFVKCWKVLMMPVMLHPYPLLYTYIHICVYTSESYRYIDIDWLKHKFLQCAVVHVMFIYIRCI